MFGFKPLIQPKIVFEGHTKKGLDIVVRYPKPGDEYQMMEFINTLSKEGTFIRLQGEQYTLEEERKVLEKFLKNIKEKKGISLLAFARDTLIASSGLTMKSLVERHIGEFGITIAKEFRGQGVGQIVMNAVISEAEKNIPDLRIVLLGCFANNHAAINLYRKMGFVEFGTLPEGILKKDQLIDHIYMYKKLR